MIKKASVYRLSKPLGVQEGELAALLGKYPAKDCGPYDIKRSGWEEVVPDTKNRVERIGNNLFFSLRVNEKKVPASALKSELKKRVAVVEMQSGEKLKKAQKDEIKDSILEEILPKTMQSESSIVGSIDLKEGWVVIGAPEKAADEFCSELRQVLGSFPVIRVSASQEPAVIFSQMILEDMEIANIEVGDTCDLVSMEDDEKASFRSADLHCDQVKAHIEMQMKPKKIQLHFASACTAIVGEDLSFSSIQVGEAMKESQGYDDIEDMASRARADLLLWSSAVDSMLKLLEPGLKLLPSRPQ